MSEQSAPQWVRSVPVPEIARQREMGWPDFHPEDFCHRCGNRNVRAWWVGSNEWNQLREADQLTPSEIICPPCFTDLYEQVTGLRVIWELRIDPESGDLRRLRGAIEGEGP